MTLDRGTVVLVGLDPTIGHEQRGVRPCVAVSDPSVNADQRFPLIAVVPVTGTLGEGLLYPRLAAGASGLKKPSCVLIDHLRSIDKRRIRRIFGKVSEAELASIDQGLALFLGLDGADPAGKSSVQETDVDIEAPPLPPRGRTTKRRKGNLADFLSLSPLRNSRLQVERSKELPRAVDL